MNADRAHGRPRWFGFVAAAALLAACGQAGPLYLPDDLRAERLERAAQRGVGARAEALRDRAEALRARQREFVELSDALAAQEAQRRRQLAAGRDAGEEFDEADETLGEINRLRTRLGRILLERQREAQGDAPGRADAP